MLYTTANLEEPLRAGFTREVSPEWETGQSGMFGKNARLYSLIADTTTFCCVGSIPFSVYSFQNRTACSSSP